MSKKVKYLDVIANAFDEKKAWRSVSMVLSVLVVGLTGLNIYQTQNKPTVLVPYELATIKGNVNVQTNGGVAGTDAQYLSTLALGDLGLVLTFSPENAVVQSQRFLNRLTPDLYAAQQVEIQAQAADFATQRISQTFYPKETKVDVNKGITLVRGSLRRWVGDKEAFNTDITYRVTYTVKRGYFHISDLRKE